ncbi:hypothetical protein ACPJXG_24715 [Janthinobacterium sp. NFX145]|uniref:hypothetical protein n=1 Tax=unclassified Janthinobacterium TaxID=2610881 RepID=UPI001269B524|nr:MULTISPECIES: hypothetical protein [unclassified Janthinobacterium]NVI82866.1 hypothetical protein [Janthinobacterium sp. BJB401]
MIDNDLKKHNISGFVIFILIIVFSSASLPAIFGKAVTVSPMLIFVMVILSSLPHYIKPKNKKVDDEALIFGKIFFINLSISAFLSILAIFIYKFALTFN